MVVEEADGKEEAVTCCCTCCQCGLVRACDDKIEVEALAAVLLVDSNSNDVVVSWDRQPRKPSKAPNRNRIVRGPPIVQVISSAFS